MARWIIKTDTTTGKVSLTYIGCDRALQDCGACETGLTSQLLDWMFSPGQVDPFDIIEMDGREFFALNKRARA